jgi:G3E family GTPase
LVNHLLRQGTGRRTVVLVNDVGALAVDDELIESRGDGLITLANGCVCCSLRAPLADAFAELDERPGTQRPELVVIECSGVADPAPVSHHALVPGFSLLGVVVVVDAESVQRRAVDPIVGPTIRRQLRAASLLVVNKVDLVTLATLAGVHAWLDAVAPGVGRHEGAALPLAGWSGAPATGDGADPDVEERHEHWSWRHDGVIERAALERFLDALPATVVRAKGIVALDGSRRTVVQVVGSRRELRPGPPWGDELPASRLVVIAPRGGLAGLDTSALPGSAGEGSPGPSTMGR